ncbi:uncharacterized protein Dwil_GK15733 [Drosophila willistoni]|uniref:Uncharacterized protein n=1 Tax=Drosophila willistoni TaxID=7260 RepID=B4MRK9_DROWI|nr:uncharacterized protein Dwil_GK15733 [Drosophila willistoni]
MEDIEYLDEYKDLVMPGKLNSAATSAASALGSGQRRRRLSSDSTNSSSIDADIFQKLFHGKFTDDELPTKSTNLNSKGRGRRSPLSPSSSDESNDALEALFNRKTNLGTQAHKRRERYESLDSIDDLSQALMRPTHRSSATKPKKAFPQKTSNSSTSNSNRGNVSAKSTSSLSTKSSTGQPAKSKRSSDVFRSGGPTNGNVGGRNKAVTIVKPIKSSLSPNKREPKTDPLNLKDYIDGSDSDSSYEYESDFYGDEEDDDISNPIIDLSTDTSRTNSVADTVTPVVSEDDDPADAAVQQEHQDPTTSTEPQPQQTSMCGDNELLQYYLNNLSKAETPPIYKKLSSGRKCRSSEKKSPSNSLEQVKHGAIESGGSVVDKEVATGPEENRDSIETACSTEKPKEKPYDLNDSLTLESVQRMSLDLAEQIMQIDNERTIEYERHSGSKGRSVRSRSNMSDDHPSTSNSKSSALAHRHVRKLTYSNDQLDKCVPLKANELRRTQSDSAFPKRDSRGRLNKKRQSSSVATDQSNSTEVATSSVPTETPIKRKRGRPRKMKPQGIEIKSSETKPENNTETELELTKENIQNPPDKEISIVKTDNEITTPETVSSLETPAQIENENKDSTLTEKTINAAENQLSAKDVRVDENATLEIHQSQNEIPTEDSKLISEIKNVPKDLKPVQDSTEALGALPEVSVKRRALRSDDRKSELSSHEVETTPLQAQANESRSSRRIPKSETPVPITEQMTSIRNRRRNDSLKLASEQSSASTTSDIERDKSPIGKQPRSTQKRNKDKFIRDNKELASSLSPFAERITRSTKREEAILELPQASDSIQQRGESTRSSERYSRRDPANRSRKELEAESTENSEIANQPESRTENQKSKEKSAIKKKTKKIVDSQPNADPELVEKKAGDKSGDMETKIQNTASDETEIVQDVEPNPKQQSGGDTEMNPIEKITETKIQKDENIKPMKDDEVIEPVQESTKSNLEQDNNVESDLVEQTTDDLEINPFEKIAQDKIEKEENIKPMQNEAIIEPVHESTKSNSEHDNIVKDKQNTEVETEQPEKSEGKISENSTIEKKRLRPKNKNVLDKVIGDSEIEPAEQKAKLKSGKKKGRQNDNESEILVQAESTQEIATEETCLDLDRESRFKKETSVSVEGPKQTQEEANFENRVEVCCKEKSTKTVSPDAVPQVGEEVAVLKADVNKKVELIQTSVDGEIELVTENTLESNEHEQIQNEEAESMQTEIESPPELNIEETPVENEVNSIDEEPDAVHAAKQKKIEEQKKDLHPIVKNQGRRRKQVNEEEQPNKKRTRLDTEIKTVGKRHVTTIGQKKTLSSGGRGNIETSTESIKKPLIQTLLGPDVSLRKPENVNKSMDSKKINSDEQSYVTVLTKKPTVAATATSQETKSAHTSVGAAPRKVNISISVLPPKEVEVELPVASTITEKRNITASTMVSKKNKCIPNKTTPIAPPKKANLLNAAKIPDKNLLAQSEQSKKSEPRKSEVKTGLEATIAPATKPLAKAKQGSEAVAKTDKTVVEHPVKQLPEPQLQLELEVSANKSLEQQKKLPSRKSEGGKARRSAIKTDPLSNTIERKSLPLTRPSQESSSSSTTLKASEVESYESAESLDHSLSLVKRKSQDNKQSSDGSEKVLLETEVVSSSMDASKDQLVEKKSRKTVASVTTHMTRSSSCNRSLSATPIATPQRQRKVPNKVSGVPLVSGKVEAQELPATPRMNSRRSQKDLSTPYLELVNHGYTRKRKMPANAATDAKRAKQQPQPNEETKSTESWAEEMLAQEVRVEVDIPQQQVQQNEMQLEQTDQNRKHQSQNLQEEVVQPMETDVQLQEVQETAVQQNKDVDRQQEEHTNVAFPVMITAAIDKPPLAAATSASIVAHPNPSDTLVEEVRTIRRCRVRLNLPPQVPPTRSIEDQLPALPTLHEIEQVHETLPPPEPTPAREEVKSEAEDIPVVEPVSQPMDISPDPTPAATLAPSHAPHQVIRINAPTRSASNQNNATSIGGSGAAAGQLPFGSTKMFSFLYPMRYQHSYGAVGLDFCCPNLDGPMRAIDPTRLHDKVELPVLELPQYMVISTKFISKQDKNIPNKVRAKMAEMAKDGKPLTGQTIQTGMLTPDPILSVTNDASAPVSVPPLAPIPVPSLLTAAPASIPEPEVSSIDALSRQLPRGTTLTKKVLPPGASMPLQAGSSNASQLGPRELIQLPPICPADKQRCELQTRVQLFDLVLQELSRRATLLTVAERQKTIEEIVKTSTLLPIDVDVGTKLLENYVYYLNRATNSNIPVPSYRINTVAPATTMPSPAMTNTQSPVSNSVLSKCTPRKLPASIPLYDSDRNIIGYQRLTESVTTKGLPVTCSTSIVPTQLTQDHRVLSTPADKTNARATAITHRKVVAKTMTPPAHWTSPEETGPTIRSIKNIGNGKMISFNPPSVQKPSTTFKPQTITKSPAIGNVSNPTRSKPITTPAPISVPAAPNITPNLFVVNQVSAQPEECILPDVTNTVPLETEIKGEVEDVVEIVP